MLWKKLNSKDVELNLSKGFNIIWNPYSLLVMILIQLDDTFIIIQKNPAKSSLFK